MKDTRIEILRDGLWRSLELASNKAIKYNAVINQIGKVATREISHTNTFSIPYIHTNVSALGLNVFNPADMAKAMNAKYEATYYVEGKLLRTGYIVINNTRDGAININFIDEALSLLDKWGSTTYKELLNDTVLDIPADYAVAIQECHDYFLDVNNIVAFTSEVGTRGYKLTQFPNTLNTIGDDFHVTTETITTTSTDTNGDTVTDVTTNEARIDNTFNSYQCRPVWNVKALFDLATESYGYTPIYDDSVDWDAVANMYMIEESKNEEGATGIQTINYNTVNNAHPYNITSTNAILGTNNVDTLMLFEGDVLKPNDIPNWVDPDWLVYFNYFVGGTNGSTPWMSTDCVFVPIVTVGNVGTMTFNISVAGATSGVDLYKYNYIWKSPVLGSDVVHQTLYTGYGVVNPDPNYTETVTVNANSRDYEIVVDKATFNTQAFGVINNTNLFIPANVPTASGAMTWNAGNNTITSTTTSSGSVSIPLDSVANAAGNFKVSFDVFVQSGDLFVEMGTGGTQVEITPLVASSITYNKSLEYDKDQTGASLKISGTFRGTISNIQVIEMAACTELIGLMISVGRGLSSGSGVLSSMIAQQEFLPEGVVTFDEQGQYLPSLFTLTHNAPRKTIKDLLSGYMHKDGILMDIDAKAKTVKFFNYQEYENNKDAGVYTNFSNYLLKYDKIERNTDYGNQFAKLNRIGLNSPYPGNTYDYTLTNQGDESKFKDFTVNNNSVFKDIEDVQSIPYTTSPYFEYTNTGLGLVEQTGVVSGPFAQTRFDGTTQGSIVDIPHMSNVNMAVLPSGVDRWYNLVDEALKVSANFLVPVEVMTNLDMSAPIYVEELGGFYIIEKVEEYVNGITPVKIKLIKLIDNLDGVVPGAGNTVLQDPWISLTSSPFPANGIFNFIDRINSNISFFNYTPVNAEITYKKLDDSTANGGTYTGYVVSHTFVFGSSYENITHTLNASQPTTAQEEGYYEIQVEDLDTGLTSLTQEVYLGDQSVPVASFSMLLYTSVSIGLNVTAGTFRADHTYVNHTPTTSTLTYRKRNYLDPNDQTYSAVTVNLPLTSGSTTITPVDGAGFYEITAQTNEATWPGLIMGGLFVI